MSNQNRLTQLIDALGMEIIIARAGSSQGQFPILDLLGNLRDEAAGKADLAELHRCCAEAWGRMVQIVESGRPFTQEEVDWLIQSLARCQALAAPSGKSVAPPPAPAAPAAAPAALVPPGEEPAIQLNAAADGDLLREFITESREHLDNIEQGVLVLEAQPGDAETLNTVFRAFHTFKGGAGFLNLLPVNRLAHVLESLLDLARQGKLVINPPVTGLILRGRDVLKQFVDEIEERLGGERAAVPISIPTAALKAEVQAAIAAAAEGSAGGETKTSPMATPSCGMEEGARRAEHGAIVKVDTGKLDGLLDLVGEMVIAQSLVGQDLGQIANLNPQLARNVGQLERITRELQRVSMSLRMVTIQGVFQKMARVVRDLGAKQKKQVRLMTSGEDTELDRGVVEELNDPLLHMIRNSMDHGIEAPEARAAAGKPPVATLQLRAYHQSGNIVIEVQDDGAGLNKERILKRAIERGLTTEGASHTEEEIFGFIFAAGFSTAEKVTDVSGRGVGLDVVRRNVERLRGRVDLSSAQGKGSLFKITLPLTLAIIDGLVVRTGDERYIIPTLSVCESFRPRADMISRIQNRLEVVNVRGQLIPLLRLYELFGVKPASTDPTQGIVVVMQSGASVRCLLVDSLLHKQEVVIRNLNDMMVHKNRALAGATILGDGRVALILDVNALVHLEQDQQAGIKPLQPL